jgi:hypothetical protein
MHQIEDKATQARTEMEKLSTSLVKFEAENLKLGQQLTQQEEKIKIVLKELEEVTETCRKSQQRTIKCRTRPRSPGFF